MSGARILIVEDVASLALSYAAQLNEAGFEVQVASSVAEADAQFRAGFDAILLDLQLPDGNGLDLLEAHNASLGETSVIVITADGSLSRAVSAMRLGAYDFLVKPVSGERLLTTVRNAAERGRLAREVKVARSITRRDRFQGFIGRSPVMQAVYREIENIADSNATVFITGESGTGKEVAAEAIHKSGRRSRGPFVAINCGAIPENLLESELFGHVKGAFTGAIEHRSGAVREAHGGTLFLDEICEMELKLQVKLLRFLQSGMIQKVGSSKPEAVDVRIVCATNRNPMREVVEGRFREDLFYRLNVIPLEMPPLRERGDDVVLIAEAFLERFSADEARSYDGISPEGLTTLRRHRWPGNVRELQNCVRRAVVTGGGGLLDIHPPAAPTMRDIPGYEPVRVAGEVAGPVEVNAPDVAGLAVAVQGMSLMQIERFVIEAKIDAHGGNVTDAARELGISPSTIYRKLERWNGSLIERR